MLRRLQLLRAAVDVVVAAQVEGEAQAAEKERPVGLQVVVEKSQWVVQVAKAVGEEPGLLGPMVAEREAARAAVVMAAGATAVAVTEGAAMEVVEMVAVVMVVAVRAEEEMVVAEMAVVGQAEVERVEEVMAAVVMEAAV